MSIAGPSVLIVFVINIGHESDQRLPKILPFVRSLLNDFPPIIGFDLDIE